MYWKSDNIDITVNDETDEFKEELLKSLQNRY